jgi:NADP-dependent 3-hydroxy acid dehydrogenase YdfG
MKALREGLPHWQIFRFACLPRSCSATNWNRNFTGKAAFVTGAGGGIGRATALAFARAGANVVVADISEQNIQETARLIEERSGRALAVRCDVTRAEDVKGALDRTIETFGRLDVAFNNAGSEQAITATADLTEEEWDRIIRINLRGVFLCMKYEIPLLLKQGGGAIVNTSSGAGVKGFKGQAAYAAAQHGVIGLTKSAAPRLRAVEPPHQRRVPRDYRYPDDAAVHRGHARGGAEGDRAGTGRQDGEARGDCRRRHLAVFGCGRLRRRARHGRRRRPNGAVMFVASRDSVAANATSLEIPPGGSASAFVEGPTAIIWSGAVSGR